MGDGRERRKPRGVSDSKTGGTSSKRKAVLDVAEARKVAERKWGTQIGSLGDTIQTEAQQG